MTTARKHTTVNPQPKTKRSSRSKVPNKTSRKKRTEAKDVRKEEGKEVRRRADQIKRWLHGSRGRKIESLVWRDDPKTEQYEGREGGDIIVMLAPYDDSHKSRKGPLPTVKKPPEDSGLSIYTAQVRGLHNLSGNGRVLYYITAKSVQEAKTQVAEVIVKCRLSMVDAMLQNLTNEMHRPKEAVLYLALRDLAQKALAKKENSQQYGAHPAAPLT